MTDEQDEWAYLEHANKFGLSNAEQIAVGFGWQIDHERIAQKLEAKAADVRAIGCDPKWIEWRAKKSQERENEKVNLSKSESEL